ncbi:GTPase HflX [Alkalihalobacterium chitinilyticum]|uniref:GTPase HflX n=1 Tax=Alkalihalobacterium chitinilyticum TaxID=2980103 RepID=A0ABT5VC60_9BACI|nr:GTPase HflX [Alkalihalobacterium chitinilyticum]MDE5412875.1 GTPase HflX [Alkalihalobacterium chitinilyticum]
MQEVRNDSKERVILAGCQTKDRNDDHFLYSMEELKSLTATANGEVVAMIDQKKVSIDPATYLGRGKIEELSLLIEEKEPDLVIFNDELSAGQIRNISSIFGEGVRVIDRTQLILDIFAQRAQSREGKLQVELAQLNYLLPRLMGRGLALSRLGGGIGTRGPGETQLETDRRHIRRRMDEIKQQLSTIVQHRKQYRERRKENQVLQIALVGYTNAGKSTILNRLTAADTFEQNLLFATLDPTTRKLKLPSGLNVLLSDTVGFIQDLPTTLIAAFRSTLEEVQEADLILHIIDASHENFSEHEKTVLKLLEDLDVNEIPMLTVYNKADLIQDKEDVFVHSSELLISAKDEKQLRKLQDKIEETLKQEMVFYKAKIHSDQGKLLARIKTETILLNQDWDEETETYECEGYVHPNHSLAHQLNQTEH